MTRVTIALALLAALLIPGRATAQARVYGSITDDTGGVLPGVEVTARNGASRETRSIVTDGSGSFEFAGIAPGTWELTSSLPGFENATRTITVQGGAAIEWSPTLQIGSIQETITITTDPPAGPLRHESPRPASRPNAPTPRVAGTVRVGGSLKPPVKVVDVHPVYPAGAAAQGTGGVVILSAVIDNTGIVRNITTVRSPDESLTRAASDALQGWEFAPTLLNGVPVETRMTATFNFQSPQ